MYPGTNPAAVNSRRNRKLDRNPGCSGNNSFLVKILDQYQNKAMAIHLEIGAGEIFAIPSWVEGFARSTWCLSDLHRSRGPVAVRLGDGWG